MKIAAQGGSATTYGKPQAAFYFSPEQNSQSKLLEIRPFRHHVRNISMVQKA